MQPHFVPEELIETATERTARKKQLPALAGLRLEDDHPATDGVKARLRGPFG